MSLVRWRLRLTTTRNLIVDSEGDPSFTLRHIQSTSSSSDYCCFSCGDRPPARWRRCTAISCCWIFIREFYVRIVSLKLFKFRLRSPRRDLWPCYAKRFRRSTMWGLMDAQGRRLNENRDSLVESDSLLVLKRIYLRPIIGNLNTPQWRII